METLVKPNLVTAKIVAAPTLSSWSQVYTAGKLFAAVSLKRENPEKEKGESLSEIGKELLEKLEQEFFTIEEKNLASIKDAIEKTFADFPNGVIYSFSCCVFQDLALDKHILYAFSKNNGGVFLKRGEKFGKILDNGASSGFLENGDLIILTTSPFSDLFPNDTLSQAILNQTPSEIAESLSPKVHEKEEGEAAAVIVQFQLSSEQEFEPQEPNNLPKQKTLDFSKYLHLFNLDLIKKLKLPLSFQKINHKRKVFLTLSLIIFFILAFSVFSAVKKQGDSKREALFREIYPQAEKKYGEGQGLSDLNKSLARDSFQTAQKLLDKAKFQFPKNSKEEKQILYLLNKVQAGLNQVSAVESKSGLDRSKLSAAVMNGSGIEGAAGKAASILKELGYKVASTGNADNYNYQGVTIKVKKDKSDFLTLLKKDLAKDYTVSSSSSDLPSSSPTDALIIIGK